MSVGPRVTIAIPTYNRARELAAAIDSAAAQRFESLEVLVVDNASTDDTQALLEARARALGPRFRFVVNSENLGMQGNFTRCVQLARGELLKIWCSDDTAHPELVARQVARLDASPGAVACTARRRRRSPSLMFRWYDRLLTMRGGTWPGPEAVRRVFRVANLIGGPVQLLTRRAPLLERLPFRDDATVGQMFDVEPLLRLLAGGWDLEVLDETLCDYNSTASSETTASLGDFSRQDFFFRFREEQHADPQYRACLRPGDLEASRRNAALLLSLSGFVGHARSEGGALQGYLSAVRAQCPTAPVRGLQAALLAANRVRSALSR